MIRSRKRRTKSTVWNEPAQKKSAERNEPGWLKNQREVCREIVAAKRAHEREEMPREEIERRIVAKLIECGKAARPFLESDIRTINVPFKEAQRMLKRCVARAEQEFPELRDRLMAA